MKRLFFLLLATTIFFGCKSTEKTTHTSVNERDVPPVFYNDFKKLRPQAEQSTWRQIDSLSYAVQFSENNMNMEMVFTKTSVVTFWNIPREYAPSTISQYLSTEYPGYHLKSLRIAEIKHAKSYQALAIKGKTKDFILFEFDLQGNFQKILDQKGLKED